jgi:predicted DNA-binding transcriptional regulator AlpA
MSDTLTIIEIAKRLEAIERNLEALLSVLRLSHIGDGARAPDPVVGRMTSGTQRLIAVVEKMKEEGKIPKDKGSTDVRKIPKKESKVTQRYLSPGEAADFLSVSVECLRNWRNRGNGPRWVKLRSKAGRIRYRESDLIEWAERLSG